MVVQRKKYIFWAFAIFLLTSILIIRMMFRLHVTNQTPNTANTTTISRRIKVIKDFRIKETHDFLINTPGCYIPNYAKTYKYNKFNTRSVENSPCGERIVFIDTLGNNRIIFRIDEEKMKKYSKRQMQCCYKFVSQSKISGHEHDQLSYTPCINFKNGSKVKLQEEVITVTCRSKYFYGRKIITYKKYNDAYIKLQKDMNLSRLSEINLTKNKWNVLMIGLNSMSRTRVFDTIPYTSKYLKQHKWLDYKGYQNVQNSTFQNLMSVLTGKNISTIYSKCSSDLSKCANYFIWQKYKDAGYRTALGETNLRIPNTFSNGFKTNPTDHFMRPLFLTGQRTCEGIVCMQKKPSLTHLLEYAHSFVDFYKENNFFGTFWINSYTYFDEIPSLLDTEIVDFFGKLNNSGVFNNTFVILFSDHGTRFGKMKLPIESYYDERLPMLFLWTPLEFRSKYIDKHYNLQVNQERLTTPYDLYITLADILKLSTNSSEETQSEACPQCTGVFVKKSPNRTCADAGVNGYLCSCHNISKMYADDERLANSISLATARIHKIQKSIKTIPCTACKKLGLPTITRSHMYHYDEKTFYVIAFHMSPKHIHFEAIVVYHDKWFEVLSVNAITQYNSMGNCALERKYRSFCICVHKECRRKSSIFMRPPSMNLAEFSHQNIPIPNGQRNAHIIM